ncbi:hypothetical protein JCM10908_002619 [Rhodotorula pacifica]|uniref:uncharacterized protein n=1 Tax=Rhodotorula pacifica TaxID=1495444 RepID=UPI00316C0906
MTQKTAGKSKLLQYLNRIRTPPPLKLQSAAVNEPLAPSEHSRGSGEGSQTRSPLPPENVESNDLATTVEVEDSAYATKLHSPDVDNFAIKPMETIALRINSGEELARPLLSSEQLRSHATALWVNQQGARNARDPRPNEPGTSSRLPPASTVIMSSPESGSPTHVRFGEIWSKSTTADSTIGSASGRSNAGESDGSFRCRTAAALERLRDVHLSHEATPAHRPPLSRYRRMSI